MAIPLVALVPSTPLALASDRGVDGVAAHAAQSPAAGKRLSGGVGIGARGLLAQRGPADDALKLAFASTPSGGHLADVPVTIADRLGNTVIRAVSDGPWIAVDLPDGHEAVTAQHDGRTETRQVAVTAGAAQRTVHLRFPVSADGHGSMKASAAPR